jgi:hypothetical protein
MPGRITSIFISLLGLALMFTSDARAQVKTERAVTSNFVKVWLPSDAEEITPATVPAQITQALGKVVADAGRGRFKQYDTQVLVWRGAAFRRAGADSIIKSLREKFKKMEYRYEAGETSDGVTPFRIDDDTAGTIVVGFYLVKDDGLLWAWTQVYE